MAADDEGLMHQLESISKRLERLVSSSIDSRVAEPPRLVKANSAFDLLKAVEKLRENADFAELAAKA